MEKDIVLNVNNLSYRYDDAPKDEYVLKNLNYEFECGVAIARSLSYNPQIILADEPMGNLDKDTENEILKIFKKLARKENKCIIIVTHSDNVCNQSDVIYELKKWIMIKFQKLVNKIYKKCRFFILNLHFFIIYVIIL